MRRLLAALLACAIASAAVAGIPPQSGGPSQTPPANDQATAVVTGSFGDASSCDTTPSDTNTSGSFLVQGPFNVVLYGPSGPNGSWNASVQVERSFDGGTTWVVAGVGGGGQQAVYSTPNQDVSIVANEPERGVIYRLHCTAYTSGSVNYRFSTTSSATLSPSPY